MGWSGGRGSYFAQGLSMESGHHSTDRLSSSAGGGYCTFARAQKLLQARCRVFEG